MRAPFVTARDAVDERGARCSSACDDADGLVGDGEAAPLEDYDGVTLDDVRAALEDCREVLAQSDGADRRALLDACARLAVLPQAVAAIDLALWDLAGRRAGAAGLAAARRDEPPPRSRSTRRSPPPIAPAPRPRPPRPATAGLSLRQGEGRRRRRRRAPRRRARRRAARTWRSASTPTAPGRCDEAVAALRALAPAGIELCEEPVHGLERDRARSRAPTADVAVAMDETAREPGRARLAASADAVCLKIARAAAGSRGVHRGRPAAPARPATRSTSPPPSTARSGSPPRLHAAAAIRPDRPCGLATLGAVRRPHRPALRRRTGGSRSRRRRAWATAARRPLGESADGATHAPLPPALEPRRGRRAPAAARVARRLGGRVARCAASRPADR